MNYIHQLQSRIRELEAGKKATSEAINLFRAHLVSDKFKGCESDGERKDWISTGDVRNWLNSVEFDAVIAEDNARTEFMVETVLGVDKGKGKI